MIPFVKMQGIGNDFVMVDAFDASILPDDLGSFSRSVCDRRYGVGADGLILVGPGTNAPFQMRMFNPDGSESEMCGNGLRCAARLLVDNGHATGSMSIETGAGVLTVESIDARTFSVDMGQPRLRRGEIGMVGPPNDAFLDQPVDEFFRGTAVSMGNPHLVVVVVDVSSVELEVDGPRLENHGLFPNRTNVHFIQIESPTSIRQRTWERGAGATLACGTGACASAVAAHLLGLSERHVTMHLPGGDLEIELLSSGHVQMTGPADVAFYGTL